METFSKRSWAREWLQLREEERVLRYQPTLGAEILKNLPRSAHFYKQCNLLFMDPPKMILEITWLDTLGQPFA